MALSRQAPDDDDDEDDRCATCVSLNLARFTPELCLLDAFLADYANEITRTSLLVCVPFVTSHMELFCERSVTTFNDIV